MTSALAVLAAGLGGSFLTGGFSLGVLWLQHHWQRKAADSAALHAAIMEVMSRSLAVAMRGQTMGETMKVRSGLIEGLDVALHHRKPADPMELHDWLAQDVHALNEALSEIWTRWDQEGVRLANDVAGKSMNVMGVSTEEQPARGARERVRRWALGQRWTPEMREANAQAVKDLARARKRLADYTRAKLGNRAVDLFAQVTEEPAPVAPAVDAVPDRKAIQTAAPGKPAAPANGQSGAAG